MKKYLLVIVLACVAVMLIMPVEAAVFAKYDGVDGESQDANHDKWIDVLSFDWGAHKPGGGATGQSRRRGGVIVEDVTLTVEYDKASPKLQEKMLMGEVIPKLEIEQTANYGGSRATYLKYELKNVMITSFSLSASGNDESGPPTVVYSTNFEEIKVTYTEFDRDGGTMGNVEYEWKVEKGAK
jgi:type VI secretion system secreted protein Hcp